MTRAQVGALADLQRACAALQEQLDEQRAVRDAALAREAALAEVLDVINRSPGDLVPVFDTILARALQLCDAAFGNLYIYDGEHFQTAAMRGAPAAWAEFRAKNPPGSTTGGPVALLLKKRRAVHALDLMEDESYQSGAVDTRAFVDLAGARTALAVPLLKAEALHGYMAIYRQEVRAFSVEEITLLENFAAQAVVAIENARLLEELQKRTAELAARDADNRALIARQEATIEVMKTISASPDDTQPVFDLIARRTRELCDARAVVVHEYDGTLMHIRAIEGHDPEAAERLRQSFPRPPGPETIPGRAVLAGKIVHTSDLQAEPGIFQTGRDLGIRTGFSVPLLREGRVIGMITLSRFEVRAFDAAEVALVEILRRTGGDRDHQRRQPPRLAGAHGRSSGIARIPDRDQRRIEGHQPVDIRSATRSRYAGRDRRPPLRRRLGCHLQPRRRRISGGGRMFRTRLNITRRSKAGS